MIFRNIFRFFTFADYPKQVKFIMWNEAAERYAFYGMRAILVIYVSQYLKITDNIASAMFNYFNAFAYLTPILGAYIADKYLGKFKIIVIFSLIYAAGFLTLAFSTTFSGLIVALFLIGLGTGGIKPCISTFMGDQLDCNAPNYDNLRAKAFGMFYFMINFGSIISTFLTPITRELFGPRVAFSIPAILMLLSLVIFLMGRKHYIHVSCNKEDHPPVFGVIIAAFKNFTNRIKGETILSGALTKYSKQEVYGTYNLLQIVKIFAFMVIFYAVWDQQGSSWVIQAINMDGKFLGVSIPPDIMQVFNPLFILLLVPIFNKYVYPYVNNIIKLTPLRKIGTGITLSGIAFISLGIFQQFLDAGIKINILWQVVTYFIMTCAEVLVIITAMEFAYSQAPKSMKSIIMSLFWLTVFLGDLLAGIMLQVNIFKGASFFYFWAILAIVIGFLFIPVSKTYKHKEI